MGLTHAWNEGVHYALNSLDAQYIFIVNNDILMPTDVLKKMIRHLERDDRIGVISPLSNAPGEGAAQDIRHFIAGYIASDSPEDIQKVSDSLEGNGVVENQFVNRFFMGFKQETFKRNIYWRHFKTFYFNPLKLNFGNEDEFQLRLKKIGLKSCIATDSFVFHYKDVSVRRWSNCPDGPYKNQIFRK